MWLVDLGGSERLLKTQAKGQTLTVNMSLSALCGVINALQKKQPHVPFRNNKLTQILKILWGKNPELSCWFMSARSKMTWERQLVPCLSAKEPRVSIWGESCLRLKRRRKQPWLNFLTRSRATKRSARRSMNGSKKSRQNWKRAMRAANEAAAAKLKEEQESCCETSGGTGSSCFNVACPWAW